MKVLGGEVRTNYLLIGNERLKLWLHSNTTNQSIHLWDSWRSLHAHRHHSLVDLLSDAIVPILNEFTHFKLAGTHLLKVRSLLWMHFLNRFKHIFSNTIISVLILNMLWYFLVFKSLDVHEVTKITSWTSLWSMKVSAHNCFSIIIFDNLCV